MNYSRIAEERKKLGLSQEELANKLKISQKSISKYERGTRRPSYETLLSMSSIFGVSVDYLLGNDAAGIDYVNYQLDSPEFALSFKEKLKEILKEKKISESDFSVITGFHPDDANAYLWGNKIPSIEDLIKIAGTLKISSDYLLGISTNASISEKDKYFLQSLTDMERNMIEAYRQLNEDNQYIIIGDMKKYLKEQRYEDSVAAEPSVQKAK